MPLRAFPTGVAAAIFWLAITGSTRADEMPPVEIELTLLDDQAIGFATFQSHNQKVVSGTKGIYLTYLNKSNADYTAQNWRLMHSGDGGRTFAVVREATEPTSAPAIEIDSAGTLYLARPNFLDGDAYVEAFDPRGEQGTLWSTRLPGGSAGKYCQMLDEPRGRLYYLSISNKLFTVGLDGTLLSTVDLIAPGSHAIFQYPHLSLGPDGTLYAAWTTSHPSIYLYWSIHAIRSPDGAATWQSLDGKELSLPIVADDTGPATMISKSDEFEVHSWLSALMAKDDKLHFAYWAKTTPERQRYVRYDGPTGRLDLDRERIFAGRDQAQLNDSGLLAARRGVPGTPLYFVSTVDDRRRLACLASDDGGETWREYAVSDRLFPFRIYSIGGAREVTADGSIVGTFTDVREDAESYHAEKSGEVYFFRIKAK